MNTFSTYQQKKTDKEIVEIHSVTISSKKMKYLGKNITKEGYL